MVFVEVSLMERWIEDRRRKSYHTRTVTRRVRAFGSTVDVHFVAAYTQNPDVW